MVKRSKQRREKRRERAKKKSLLELLRLTSVRKRLVFGGKERKGDAVTIAFSGSATPLDPSEDKQTLH